MDIRWLHDHITQFLTNSNTNSASKVVPFQPPSDERTHNAHYPGCIIAKLPFELLSCIIGLVQSDPFVINNIYHLARVSKYWADVILNSLTLWRTIKFSPGSTLGSVAQHVNCCGDCMFDIVIQENHPWCEDNLAKILDHLLGFKHRWRSLFISTVVEGWRCHIDEVLKRLERQKLTSLKYVSINCPRGFERPQFFSCDNLPVLKYLHVSAQYNLLDITSGLKTVKPDLGGLRFFSSRTLSQFQQLTVLRIKGNSCLPHGIVHLPFLQSLTVIASRPHELLKSIQAPALKYFCFFAIRCPHYKIQDELFEWLYFYFRDLRHNLSTVEHLWLHKEKDNTTTTSLLRPDVEIVYTEFPNVHHVTLAKRDFNVFFCPRYRHDVMKAWEKLETICIEGEDSPEENMIVGELKLAWPNIRVTTRVDIP